MLLSNTYNILYTKTLLNVDLPNYLLSKLVIKNDGDTNFKINVLINDIYLLSGIVILPKSYKIFERKLGLDLEDRLEIEVYNANLSPGSHSNTEGFLEAQETYRNFLYSQNTTRSFLAGQQRFNTNNTETPVTVTLHYLN